MEAKTDYVKETSDQERLNSALIAAAMFDGVRNGEDTSLRNGQTLPNPWQILGPWRMIGEARRMNYTHQSKNHQVAISLSQATSGTWYVQVDAQPAKTISCFFGNDDLILLRSGTMQVNTYVRPSESETQVILDGRMYRFMRRQPPGVDVTAHGGNVVKSQKALTAPMAGTIVKVQVRDGETVQHRQVLVILSAMKMEHTIIAPYEGKVRKVHYHEGEVVKGGAVIVEMV